jgi:two-component system response regulator ResD
MYRTALTMAGYEVREAGDGMTALAELEQHPPDLVILDLMLPTVSGQVVLAELTARAGDEQIPVVVVTASPDPVSHDCLLRKPVMPERLVETVRNCLTSARQARLPS